MFKEELRDYIARTNLALLGSNETLDAEDAQLIETVMENCQGELEQIEVALWQLDDVPAYACASFALMVQGSINAFGFPLDLAMKAVAVKQLRYLTADRRHGTGTAEYF